MNRAQAVENYLAAGRYIDLAEFICNEERAGIEAFGRYKAGWKPLAPEAYTAPISLDTMSVSDSRPEGEYIVKNATFHVHGDDEAHVMVERGIETMLRHDPWASDLLKKFGDAYALHEHELCLEVLGRRFQEKRQGTALFSGHASRP